MWWGIIISYVLVGVGTFFLVNAYTNECKSKDYIPTWAQILFSALWPLSCTIGFVLILCCKHCEGAK